MGMVKHLVGQKPFQHLLLSSADKRGHILSMTPFGHARGWLDQVEWRRSDCGQACCQENGKVTPPPPPPPGAYPQRARACCILNKHTRHRRQLHDGDAYIRLTRGCMQLISCRAQESLTRWRCSKANKSR